MEISLPVTARWVQGQRANSKILIDPYNVRMRYKGGNKNNDFYFCSKFAEQGCLVRVTVKRESNMIIALRGEQNHDSDLLKAMVEEKCQDVIKNAVDNVNVAPRTALKDLTNVIMSDNQMGSSGLLHLPKPRSIAKTIQRKRKTDNNILDLPHQWENMYVSEPPISTGS